MWFVPVFDYKNENVAELLGPFATEAEANNAMDKLDDFGCDMDAVGPPIEAKSLSTYLKELEKETGSWYEDPEEEGEDET